MQNTYGVLSNGIHVDVSNTERGAKNYATRNGYNTVTIRYNCGYIVQEIAHKVNKKWVVYIPPPPTEVNIVC